MLTTITRIGNALGMYSNENIRWISNRHYHPSFFCMYSYTQVGNQQPTKKYYFNLVYTGAFIVHCHFRYQLSKFQLHILYLRGGTFRWLTISCFQIKSWHICGLSYMVAPHMVWEAVNGFYVHTIFVQPNSLTLSTITVAHCITSLTDTDGHCLSDLN